MKPFKCPVCNGHGTVSKPPWIAGDQITWSGTSLESYPCPACIGTGIIWGQDENDSYCSLENTKIENETT